MAARQSYFAEKRGQNNDPNFFNRISIDEIRKNVRRIIRDIKNDLIQDQDWVYFHNANIRQACIEEAYENYTSAMIICNALNYYINEGLNSGFKPMPSCNVQLERIHASKEQVTQNMRAKNWFNIYQMFLAVNYGADIIQSLAPIKLLDGRDLATL